MKITRSTIKEFKRGLKQFRRPTQQYFEHYIPSGFMLRLSEGCHYLRIKAGAYWLFNEIASGQNDERIQSTTFQVWQLNWRYYDWELECTNGRCEVIHSVKIDFARFPLDEFMIVVYDGVALLPAEYRAQYFKN